MSTRFDAMLVLDQLKDFQRSTVDYVFQQMYGTPEPTTRFLVADEVGLGKTLVAKGLIAKVVEHLQPTVRRIDIIYVCSNADIAVQNVSRLNVTGQPTFAKATRLTLLPLELKDLDPDPAVPRINFVSFTPGTTFELGNRGGTKPERRLIYQMLAHKRDNRFAAGLCELMCVTADEKNWPGYADEPIKYDEKIACEFRLVVFNDHELSERLLGLSEYFYDRRRTRTGGIFDQALSLVGELRKQLARVCLDALEPDLVILDEFQRFRDLLDSRNEAAELAQALFNAPDVRVLLLSATPYKMYVRDEEDEDHFKDFKQTLRFLMNDNDALVASVVADLDELRGGLLASSAEGELDRFDAVKQRIEIGLLRVMCRTERVGSTLHQDAMVKEVADEPPHEADDLKDLAFVVGVARTVGARDTLDYWKSSPYLLNFMKEYELKRRFVDGLSGADGARAALRKVTRVHADRLLSREKISQFEAMDPGNARLRALMAEMDAKGLWRLLWMPASLPYWHPQGPYATVGGVTKTLVFSAWNVVPDALASMLSYEAERLMLGELTSKEYDGMDRFAGRLKDMSAFALLCPSPMLAELIDPLALAREMRARGSTDMATALDLATEVVRPLLEGILIGAPESGPVDRRWYWVALARMTMARYPHVKEWTASTLGITTSSSETGFSSHVERFAKACDPMPDAPLGRLPEDVCEVIAEFALAGPGVCALRSLKRIASELSWDNQDLLRAAWQVSEGFRSLYNRPEVMVMLQQDETEAESYWQRALRYGLEGNLASLLDEHAHVLNESLGVKDKSADTRVADVGTEMRTALSIHAASLKPDDIKVGPGGVSIDSKPLSMRCRYAVRFGGKCEDDKAVSRKEATRVAFNSPFRPFVLATTSVGQEGLDFHQWCHSVLHWNLPSNPVDLEQREGRVHRYKGYAVRKNVAKACGDSALSRLPATAGDVWNDMFDAAVQDRSSASSDLVPYWVMDMEGGAKIERCFLITPFSIEASRCIRLKRSLALYRMVFGQPRQEDLLMHLLETFSAEDAPRVAQRWRICLEPPRTNPHASRLGSTSHELRQVSDRMSVTLSQS